MSGGEKAWCCNSSPAIHYFRSAEACLVDCGHDYVLSGNGTLFDIHQQLLSAAGEDLIEQKWERNHHRLGFVLLHHRTIGIRAVKPVGRESDIKPQVRSLILT
ncbi:unnamed protein product [Symbiodinium natans]|uniref:Uncharacterized protein n=1 Tax=Symbiodinium natans TaxID=878477 RepID=A0A812RJH9_9DINO|nr:unnamed protein product [Symbiodinium natans]